MQPSPRPSTGHPSRRRRALAAAVAVALPLLSGCASGFDSPVLQDYNPAVGVNVRDDGVWGMNLLVVASESGRGTLVGVLLNKTRRTDRLVGATVESEQGAPPLQSSMLRPSVVLPPERLVQLDEPPTVQVQGEARQGLFVQLTLQFERSQPIQVQVPVVSPEGPYEDVPLP
ncbi:MAG TPA: hypothetical protein VHG70_02930 [Nocardioidaceae bacterium]|nr:hypothetical protein [Nocardioidaceae bacterium]